MASKRSIYLINPSFQLKFSLFVCSIVFISSLIYPFIIYQFFNTFIEQGIFKITNNLNLEKFRFQLALILILMQFCFISIVFVICIFQSHKIAGPLYKLNKYLGNIKKGKRVDDLFFRKGDHFQELATEFNEAITYLQGTHYKDFIYLNEVSSYISNLSLVVPEDKKAVLLEINSKLSEILNRFRNQ